MDPFGTPLSPEPAGTEERSHPRLHMRHVPFAIDPVARDR
jgi:truncated hemoglobin YjbI